MQNRNFKVRIENLNLKKTCFLESASYASELLSKYRDYLQDMGYRFVRSSRPRSGKHQVYYFCSKQIFPSHNDYMKKFPRRTRQAKNGGIILRPLQSNEYLVELHVIKLCDKRKPE